MIYKIISDRNIFLVLAVVAGFIFPQFSTILKPFTFFVLAIVMTFSLSGISTKSLFPLKNIVMPMLKGVLLNFGLYSLITIPLAYFFKDDYYLFTGIIILAATPPGVAIIPFTVKSGGNIQNSIIGTFGAFLASVLLTPLIIEIFAGESGISSIGLVKLMIFLIIVPFIISRALLIKPLIKTTEKHRGLIVDLGFTIIIYTSVGINNTVFFNDIQTVIKISFLLFLSMFGVSYLLKLILQKTKTSPQNIISYELLYAIKSSGFAVVTSLELFGDKAAIPATVLSVMTLVFLLFKIFVNRKMI